MCKTKDKQVQSGRVALIQTKGTDEFMRLYMRMCVSYTQEPVETIEI